MDREMNRLCGSPTGHAAAWSLSRRFGFRFIAAFTLLAFTFNYGPWNVIPLIGRYVDAAVQTPLTAIAGWSIVHVFHVAGIAATEHMTDSRDTAFDWVSLLTLVVVSILALIVWSTLDYKRRNLEAQATWLRYITRLMLIFVMVRYGIFKIFPLQMSPPSLGVLNEPVGQSSRMTLLWTLIGLSPFYQIFSGVLEAACAVLLMFRRTALMGVLLGVVIMSNVVLLNFCFSVPVKLGALLIVFGFMVLLWPDISVLLRLFWKQDAGRLDSRWRPVLGGVRAKRWMHAAETAYILCVLYALVPPAYSGGKQQAANLRSPSWITGEWHVDSATMMVSGKTVNAPILTALMLPMTDIYFEPDGRVMARASDGRLWRSNATVNEAQSTLRLFSYYFEGKRFQVTYRYKVLGNQQMQLEPIGDQRALDSTAILTRVPLPATYPLLQTRFQWIQEWAPER